MNGRACVCDRRRAERCDARALGIRPCRRTTGMADFYGSSTPVERGLRMRARCLLRKSCVAPYCIGLAGYGVATFGIDDCGVQHDLALSGYADFNVPAGSLCAIVDCNALSLALPVSTS